MNSHNLPPPVVPDRHVSSSQDGATRAGPRSIDSLALFQGASEIVIEHQGARYRLRITRQGKLILNK